MTPELLAAIAELLGITADEVAALTLDDVAEQLQAAFDAAATPEDGVAPVIETLTAITEATEGVRAAITEAEAAEAADAAAVEELRTRMTPVAETEPEPEPDAVADPPPEGEPAVTETPEPEDAPGAEATPEAIAAAAVTVPVVRMRRRVPAQHQPLDTPAGGGTTLTAAANVRGYAAGMPIPTLSALGEAFSDRVESLRGERGVSGKIPVARFHLNYAEDRQLTADGRANRDRIQAVTGPQAITAAGGNCAAVANRYDFENISVDDRPVRDRLARFNADRGGINVPTSPLITAPDAGVDVITEAEDAADATKPCAVVTCPTYTQVDVSAVYQCIQIGNFSRRFFPELFADWWALAGSLHARKAEGQLLDGIGAASTQVSDGQNLGAVRDLIEAGVRAAAVQRSFHRMARNAPVEWLLPEWVNDMARMDLVREPSGAPTDRLSAGSESIDTMLRNNYLNVTWYKDTETGEGQIYGAQGAGALLPWNLAPVSYMYPTGGFLFLDGGELDFGTEIRDTTMNEENNVRAFLETFENVVRVGQWSMEITHNLCVSGAASLPVVVTCPENS